MTTAPTQPGNRLERRKAQTRAALIRAAQTLIAEGRTNVRIAAILEISPKTVPKAASVIPWRRMSMRTVRGAAPRAATGAARP